MLRTMQYSDIPHATMPRLRLAAGILCAVLSSGCGPSRVHRYEIKGDVTYQGRPVEYGSVSFDPLAGPATDAAPRGIGGGFAHIRKGRYETTDAGRGHVGGPHRVIVLGLSGRSPSQADQAADFANTPQLFEPYEFTVELPTRSGQLDIEVPQH